VEVNGRLVIVNSTLANAAQATDMINREYRDLDGEPPARLVQNIATYNPKHGEVRDLLDKLAGVTRGRERKPAVV
jgi:hypothetical protein